MTPWQLADYLINHDMELQIIECDWQAILDRLVNEGLGVDRDDVWEAIDFARRDPYIISMAEKFCDHYEFSAQPDGTAKCDRCGIILPWSR